MVDYEIGYGRPPASGRFRPGVSGNLKGRLKRRRTSLSEIIKSAVNTPIEYRERGRIKVASCRELSLKMLVDRAITGDLAAAELVLKIRNRAERHGHAGLDPFSWRTGSRTGRVRPRTRRLPDDCHHSTGLALRVAAKAKVDRKGVLDVRSIDSLRASHFARAAPSRSG